MEINQGGASIYEHGRASHASAFPALENQMVLFTPFGVDGGGPVGWVDAMVWALFLLNSSQNSHCSLSELSAKESVFIVNAAAPQLKRVEARIRMGHR